MYLVPISAVLVASLQTGVLSDDSRLLVIRGADTVRYAVTDTVLLPVGEPVTLAADFRTPDGSPVTVFWHNTAQDLLRFATVRAFISSGPVTATQPGRGAFMAHWGDTSDTSIDIAFQAAGASPTLVPSATRRPPRPSRPRSPGRLPP